MGQSCCFSKPEWLAPTNMMGPLFFSVLLLSRMAFNANSDPAFFSAADPPRPPPDHFTVGVRFIVPYIGNLEGTLVVDGGWSPGQWCFRMIPELAGAANLPDTPDDPNDPEQVADLEQQRKDMIENFSNVLGVKGDESVYVALTENAKFQSWTSSGMIDKSEDDLMQVLGPFVMSAPLMVEAFRHWENLEQAEPETIDGEQLEGWRVPNLGQSFNATNYYRENNRDFPTWMILEGPPEYGLAAMLPIKFENNLESKTKGHATTQLAWGHLQQT